MKNIDINNWLDVAIQEYEDRNKSIYCRMWEQKLLAKLYELKKQENEDEDILSESDFSQLEEQKYHVEENEDANI